MPKRNKLLGSLPGKSKKDYLILIQMMDDREREQLEQEVKTIKDLDVLKNFIKKSLQNRRAYDNLLKRLPKPERIALEQKLAKVADPDGQVKLIDQHSNELQVIENAFMPDRQHYIDLVEVLPDDQAIALKNKIVQATSPNEVGQLIASWLPESFKQLNDHAKEKLSKLPDHERQKILKAAMSQNGKKGGLDMHTATVTEKTSVDPAALPPSYEEATGPNTDSISQLDIHKLIEQMDGGIPQDGWGPKLPLEGEEREEFVLLIMEFSESHQKVLKELFDKADRHSIANFFAVFFGGFNEKERIELLATIIYLYKVDPLLTIKLCNNPASVGWWDRFSLYKKTNPTQLNLLKKLDELLSQ
ncbi:hypothetical protein [Cardinium endosymbiont of Oedothorax gibbosus]|uniref:hypothetical protein n=1 Tax=Cardinium endosymbiont of Oedothorax gibbosus TaxID=931101 RepID=UPI002023C26C|nr:hypothetical protein [Cardinium endosymbiont of Oedothorax gibbosus]